MWQTEFVIRAIFPPFTPSQPRKSKFWKNEKNSRRYYQCNIYDNHMWCVARFGISHYLAFVWLSECMQMHAHAFFYLPVVSIHLNELAWCSNGSIKSQMLECQSNGLGAETCSNLTTFECCLLISKYHKNCNAMSSFTVIRHVPLCHETHSLPLQLNVFISLCFLFIIYYLFKKTLTYSCSRLGGLNEIDNLRSVAYTYLNSFIWALYKE